jgi:tight adherence protein B
VTRRRLQAVLVGADGRAGGRLFTARLCVAAACTISLAVVGLLPTIVILGGGAAVALAIRRRGRSRHVNETQAAVVDLCRATAAELRAGHASAQAFAAAVQAAPSRLGAHLQSAVVIAHRGDIGDLADAVTLASVAPGCTGLRRIAACWRVAAASGASLAPAIDRVADALQDEIDVVRDVTSSLAGPRATVHLLAGLPVLGLILGTAIGARPIDFLLGSGPGFGCLIAAAALDACGVAWAQRIASRAARRG